MKHLRDLRSMYDNTLKAKGDYHEVVDARLRDAINITRTHQRWQQCVAYTQETYYAAKQDALTSYLDNATAVGLYTRLLHHLHRLQTYENIWVGYTQQIYNHALHWTQRLEMQDHAERTKDDMYSAQTLHPTTIVPT